MLGDTDPQELIQTARNQEVTAESLQHAGPIQRFWDLNKGPLPEGKTHMVRGADDREIPWTALLIGLWIPNFFYWGLNQYITQRTLGSKSLAEGQKGIVFAAFLKLIIPFIVVIPGILAFNLFHGQLKHDAVNRNALILSEYSPDLYRSLSPSMKPDAEQQRNKNIWPGSSRIWARAQRRPSRSCTSSMRPSPPCIRRTLPLIVGHDVRQLSGKRASRKACRKHRGAPGLGGLQPATGRRGQRASCRAKCPPRCWSPTITTTLSRR